MSSTILTKVNTVKPNNFNQQIEWMQGDSDFDFLHRFVCLCHKKADKTLQKMVITSIEAMLSISFAQAILIKRCFTK